MQQKDLKLNGKNGYLDLGYDVMLLHQCQVSSCYQPIFKNLKIRNVFVNEEDKE
jgi:hypothetical protein